MVEVTDKSLPTSPLSCAARVGVADQFVLLPEKDLQPSIEMEMMIDFKDDVVTTPGNDLVTVQTLALDQLSAIPTHTRETNKKKHVRLSKLPKKLLKPKPPTPLPVIDRATHNSARGMTKNERRLHERLRAKFDGRGIAS